MPLLKRSAGKNQHAGENQQTSGGESGLALASSFFTRQSEQPGAQQPGAQQPGQSSLRRENGFFPACANPRCRSGWLHLWRSRETPVFEGGWSCSAECTLRRVEAAVRREMDARGPSRDLHHRHRVPLGLAMLEQGWITQKDLRAALAAQRDAGCGKLGEWLVRQGSASEERVTRTLGLQWGCPVLSMESHNPQDLAVLVPRLFIDAFGALPLRVAAGKIFYLGFEDRIDPALALAVERMSGLRVEAGLVQGSQFRPGHARALEARFPSAELIEAATEQAMAAALARAVEESRPVQARLVRVHDCFWLRLWRRQQAGPVPEANSIRDVLASTAVHG